MKLTFLTALYQKSTKFLQTVHRLSSTAFHPNSAFRHLATQKCGRPNPHDCRRSTIKKNKRPPSGCVEGPSGVYPIPEGGYKKYKNLLFFVCFPTVIAVGCHVAATYHEHPRGPYFPAEYMYRRSRKFPWCGGTVKSLFHNPKINALPDGYEELDDDDDH